MHVKKRDEDDDELEFAYPVQDLRIFSDHFRGMY